MIAQGRAAYGEELDGFVQWLVEMGPEAALDFDSMVHAYYI